MKINILLVLPMLAATFYAGYGYGRYREVEER